MAEKYRPLFKLDAGGMAEVYVAEAVSMAGFKKKVAIKRILPGLLKDERFVRMFLDEARLSLHLNHANVVSVFDIGKSDNTYFIVMEYVEGTTLKSLIKSVTERGQLFPVPLCIWVLSEICKGLDYAHKLGDPERPGQPLGIVHRDISPPNVLLSWNGEVKITDFGLAKATTQLESTDPGVVKGKFAYLSPEAAQGAQVDLRTDVFAVGILAYEMLTGKRLFLGETDWQTIEMVRQAEVPSIRAQNPQVTDALEAVLRKSLAQDLNARYATCADFADDLLGVLFQMGTRVSARDLSRIMEPLRVERESSAGQSQTSGNLILDLIAGEMTNFRSIDEQSVAAPAGAAPLDTLAGGVPAYDPSKPLGDQLVEGPGRRQPTPVPPSYQPEQDPSQPLAPAYDASPVPTPVIPEPTPLPPKPDIPKTVPATMQQSPAPKRTGGGAMWIVLLLLLAGGGAAAFFLLQ